ncbi:MAG: ABC transporter substrate-binding protein [Actinomycetota bacterium]
MSTPASGLRLVAIALTAALLAAACGDDDDASETVEREDVPTTTSAASAEPDEPADATTSTTTTAPVALTDSFRGVTADRIKVGVVAVDLEALAGLIDLDHGSYEDAYRAIIDDVNASGGVLGREIDVVFESYIPLGTQADEICERMVGDEEVFAVMGGLLDDGPLCYTELNDTAFIGSTQNDERVERSSAPWFTSFRNDDDAIRVVVEGFAQRGFFDETTVAVVAEVAAVEQIETVALPLLDELGVDVVDIDYIEASVLDETATDNEVALMAERQQTEGADTVLAFGAAGPRYAGGIEDLGYRPRLLTTSLGSLRAYVRDRAGRDLDVLAGSAAGNTLEQLGWWDDPLIQECIAIVEAATGTTILDPNTRLAEEPENIVSVAAACRDVRLFVAIAVAAGPDLTNDTFGQAGATLGEFAIPGLGVGSYDATTPDGNAPIYLFEWNDEIQDLESDGTVLG